MFYRADLFEEVGIKAEDIVTWDDFIEAGKVLKTKQALICFVWQSQEMMLHTVLC